MSSKPRNQHIKVFARVRPRNSQEMRSQIVVDCINNKEISVKDKGQAKNFAFDRVFGAESKQVEVYKAVVAPLINEVLQGYNCTVFAYGQTGTGKTFTMVGDRSSDCSGGWQNDPLSGIVPRTLDHLFDELKVRAEEFTVRVSFLELYNEELCDLLAPPDNDDTKTLRLYEDSMKKGSVIVSGLEERTVYEKDDVYPILEAGSLRRQTAPTLMNASSSRSHTIFTITVHVKVTTPEGEDLFKTGKLNLVDLAGSENIGRSGAVDIRAREAGNINQSLLTLGRVITSLVERTPHVPYRESKLTRILQDSLGGRTKTSIIATVSPAMCNLEETLSTFDYAHRARNITNKPEINQKMSKQVLLKNYTDEIERLRRDLLAAREKHGVYLLSEDYNCMISQIDNLNKDLINKIQLLKVREDDLAKQEEIMQSLNVDLYEVKTDLAKNIEILQVKEAALEERERALQELNNQARVLLRTADEATEDSKRLHDRLDRARMVHSFNEELVDRFKSRFVSNLQGMKQATQAFQSRNQELNESLVGLCVQNGTGCRDHDSELLAGRDIFLNDINSQLPDIVRCTSQGKKSISVLTHTVTEMKNISSSLNDCNTMISTCTSEWVDSRLPGWGEVHSQLKSNKEILDAARITAAEAQSYALAAGLSTNFPQDISSKTKKERDTLRKLKLEKSQAWVELHDIQMKQQALMEQERFLMEKMHEINEAYEKQEEKVEAAIEAAALALAEDTRVKYDELNELASKIVSNIGNGQDKSETSIVPALINLQENEKIHAESLRSGMSIQIQPCQEKCQQLIEVQGEEMAALSEVQVASEKALSVMTELIKSFETSTNDLFDKENKRLEASEGAIYQALRQLVNESSDFCDQSFANFHDRCSELKVHFKDQYQRDEKTGNTPQRKEFQYPKRLVTFNKDGDGQENVPPASLSNSKNDSLMACSHHTAYGQKRWSRYAPKTEHEKNVLRSVADRIYGMLNSPASEHADKVTHTSDDADGMLNSVLSMVIDQEGRAPVVEDEARALETLSHFIAEESERVRKRQDTPLTPNVNSKLVAMKDKQAFAPITSYSQQALIAADKDKKSLFSMGSNNSTSAVSKKNVDVKKSHLMERSQFKVSPKDVAAEVNTWLSNKGEEASSVAVPKTALTVSYTSMHEGEGNEDQPTDDVVLRLTPHVIFTDAEGREYRLIGVGGRGEQSGGSEDCSKQCLSVDASTKDVIAFKAPKTSEFLVLANGNDAFYTSGIQMCDESPADVAARSIRGPNLALFLPQGKRSASGVSRDAISVKWKDNMIKSKRKRENDIDQSDFNKDMNTLYSGEGLNMKLEKKSIFTPNRPRHENLRRKRQKHASVLRSRHFRKRQNSEHIRDSRSADYDDEDDYTDNHEVSQAGNPRQMKLVDSLSKDANSLNEFRKGGKAKIDVDNCKRHCDSMGVRIERLVEFDDALSSVRKKRSADILLAPSAIFSAPNNGLETQVMNKNSSKRDKKDYKVIKIETEKKISRYEDPLNPPMTEEEINMIQPTTAPDVEDKMLLQTNEPQLGKKATVGQADSQVEPMNNDLSQSRTAIEDDGNEHRRLELREENESVSTDSKLELTTVSDDLLEWAAIPPDTEEIITENSLSTVSDDYTPDTKSWRELDSLKDSAEPESDVVAGQLEEGVLRRVENVPKMDHIVGAALKFPPPPSAKPTLQAPMYSSALNVLMKAFMVNVEKLAEDELSLRNCLTLNSEDQDYLAQLLALPTGTGHSQLQSDQYKVNVHQVPSFQDLAIRKNKLVDLLQEFGQLSPKEQEETVGVKSFIESELHSIEKLVVPNTPKEKSDFRRFIRDKNDISEKYKKWLQNIIPFRHVDYSQLNKINQFIKTSTSQKDN